MNEKFNYLLENLNTSPQIIEMIFGLIIGVVCIILVRFIFLYSYGYKIVLREAYELKKKKETLSDLILMKDIQTELEKEIEQAMLKATFQG
jgi:hypothetical protein